MKKHSRLLSITALLSPLVLTACQSTGALTTTSNTQSQAEQAKTHLQKVMKAQLRRSFNYKSDIKLSNAIRRNALANATNEQLSSAKYKRLHCENAHDNAYVALLMQAEQQGNDIDDGQYDDKKQAIKNNYLNCQANYEKWQDSDNEEEYLPDYDSNHTKENKKSADLLNAYLFEPLEMQIEGTYQPMAGKFTLMPSVTYQSRNLLISQQVPIYIDFKKGNLYLWADTLAYLDSELVDEKLGTQWKNKWLKLSLNDKSLPKDFGSNLLKMSVQASEVANEQEPVEGFGYLPYGQVAGTLPYLDPEHYQAMSHSKRIISREQTPSANRRQAYVFRKTLMDSLNKQYPQFMAELQDAKVRKQALADKEYGKLLFAVYVKYIKKGMRKYENNLDDKGEFITKDDSIKVKQYYGVNGDKLLWSHNRFQVFNDKYPQEPMLIDAFTSFSSKADDKTFAQLPVNARTPTAENSVDIKQYFEQLSKHYEQGNGTALGKLAYQAYQGYAERAEEARKLIKETSEGYEEDSSDVDSDYDSDYDADYEEARKTTKVVTRESDSELHNESESADCVLTSVFIDMMCDADNIDVNNASELAMCKEKQSELQEMYQIQCR